MSRVCKDYLLSTFLIMAVCWGTCVLCSINGYAMDKYYVLYVPWILGGLSPTIASYFAQKKNGTVSGLKDWAKKLFDIKQSLHFYAVTILLSILYFTAQCLIAGFKVGMPVYLLIVMLPLMLLGGGLEEAGWRMILQPELEKKYSFVASTLIVSAIWWVWHLPLFFIMGTSQFGTNFFYFGIAILTSSFALATIKRISNSVFLCIFFHCLNNSLSNTLLFKGTLLSYCVAAAVVIIASFIIVRQSKAFKHIKKV